MITGLLMLVARCLSVEQARRSISWEVGESGGWVSQTLTMSYLRKKDVVG